MLKEASDKLRFGAAKTMQLAQELFEMGLCVTEDTEVVLKNGAIKPIREIVEETKESELLGFEDGEIKLCCAEVSKFWKIPYRGEVKVVKLSNGVEVKATPDHGLFVFRDGKFGWVSAKNLKKGDYLAVPFNYRNTEGRKLTLLDLLVELGITDVLLKFKDWSEVFLQKIAPIIRKSVKSSVKYKYLRKEIVPLKLLLNNGFTNKELNELLPEIEAVYPQKAGAKPMPTFELSADFWYFVGLVLGDGSLSQPAKVTIAQTPTKRVKEFVQKLFPFLTVSESSNGSVVITPPS
jgi:reverse gyrase